MPNGKRKEFLRRAKELFDILLLSMDDVVNENIEEDRKFFQEVQEEAQLRKNATRQNNCDQEA